MRPFIGFSTDKQKTLRVPEGFFEEVLPQIGSMLEMKVTLYLFWRLRRFADAGIPCDEVLRRVVREEDLPAVEMPPAKRPRGWEGRLKGRPVDLLKASRANSRHS